MNIAVCECPQHIFDKSTNTERLVPCGKCNTCRNRRASSWVDRLNIESRCWPYTVFFTLTYDEDHVPRMHLYKNGDLVDLNTGLCFSDPYLESREFRTFYRKKRSIEYCDTRDLQLFIKRLRYFFYEENKNSHVVSTLRYYIVSEYGPTTLRPHYHGLLFFRSQRCATKISDLIRKAWPLGRIDASFSKDGSKSYCARYVNSFVDLPKIYSFPLFRPKCVFSKCPSIGSVDISDQEVRKIFDSCSPTRPEPNLKTHLFEDVLLRRNLENKIFPKCQGFSSLNHSERIAVYGIARFSAAENFHDFKKWCDELIDHYYPLTPLSRYLANLYSLHEFDQFGVVPDSKRCVPLRKLWCLSRRVRVMCDMFGVSLSEYIRHIDQYYSNKALYKLKMQYEFEQEYVKYHAVQSLVFIDPLFVTDAVNRSNINSLKYGLFDVCTPAVRSTLETFSLDVEKFLFDTDYRLSLDIFNNPEYKYMVNLNEIIFKHSIKNKKKNDYLLAHPEYQYLY